MPIFLCEVIDLVKFCNIQPFWVEEFTQGYNFIFAKSFISNNLDSQTKKSVLIDV